MPIDPHLPARIQPATRPAPCALQARLLAGICLVSGLLAACSPGSPPPGKASGPNDAAPPTSSAASGAPASELQDVVLVTVDTLRHDAVGFAGPGPWRTPTPALEALAAEGRIFTRAVAHTPLTLPSHATMLTGLYPYDNGVRENAGFVLDDSFRTLAEHLSDAGFTTGAFVSAFVLDARFGLAQGFDVYDDEIPRESSFRVSERRGDDTVERALDWWRQHGDERRFLWLHLFDPHAPYAAPEPFADRFDEAYRGEVAAVDAYLSPLLDEVRGETGRSSLVIFTADHGESLGDHGELTHGIFAYQSTLQVPLVLWGSGVEPGRDDRLARHVDLLPTVLERAGVEVPDGLPGSPLTSPAPDLPTSYFEALSGVLNRGWAPLHGVIRGTDKVIDLPLPELYDLAADPDETHNRVDDERRLLAELRGLVPEAARRQPERGTASAEDAARLRSLGYLTSDGGDKRRFTPDDDPKRLMDLDRDIHRISGLLGSGAPGDLDRAVRLARSLVERRPSMAVGHTLLAHALLDAGRPSEALAAMEAARRRGAADVSLLRQLGLTLAERGRPAEAVELLEPLAGDGDPETLGALAAALSETGDLEGASRRLAGALEKAPDDGSLHEKAAVLALRRNDPRAALEHARRATELVPGSAPAWNHLGVALFLSARPLEALEAWQRSVQLDPDQFDTLYNLGTRAAELGRRDLARRTLEDFLARAPRDRYRDDLPKVRALLNDLGGGASP